jgi:Ca2+-binding EF-hand superfamily protein
MVSIDEILAAIHQIQGISSEIKEKKILEVLESLDKDHDGKIDDLSDVVKVREENEKRVILRINFYS